MCKSVYGVVFINVVFIVYDDSFVVFGAERVGNRAFSARFSLSFPFLTPSIPFYCIDNEKK